MRFVPAWQPEPEHPAGTVAGSWSATCGGSPIAEVGWHVAHALSPAAMASMTSWSVEEWQSAHASAAWIGMRFVPAWQPEPEHPAGTVAGSWSATCGGSPIAEVGWHVAHALSPAAMASMTSWSVEEWQSRTRARRGSG